MVSTSDARSIKDASLRYQWLHNKDWTELAEVGGPTVIMEGDGVRVTDSEGQTWIDACGGYYSVHVGYGRDEIAYAAYEQLKKVTFFPSGTTTVPVIQLCEKLAEITPGSLSRSFLNCGGSEANETALKITRTYHKRNGDLGRYKVHQPQGLVPRDPRPDDVDGAALHGPGADRLRAPVSGNAPRAASEPVPLRARRHDALGVRGEVCRGR